MFEAVILNDGELELLYNESSFDSVLLSDELTESTVDYKTWDFTIAPNNPCYDKIKPFKTRIIITDLRTGDYIFNGRAVVVNKSMSESGDITENVICENIELFLDDSEQLAIDFEGSPRGLLDILIERHNPQVEDCKRFDIGKVDIDTEYRTFNVPVEWETLPMLDDDGNVIGETIAGNKDLNVGDTATIKTTAVYYNSFYHGANLRIADFAKGRKNTVNAVDRERNAYRLYYGTTPIGWVDAKDISEASTATVEGGYQGELKPVIYSRQRKIKAEITSGTTTLDAIRTHLLEPYGGYLIVDYHEASPRLNIVTNPGANSVEVVEVGVNLMSLNADFDPSDIYTVSRPIGTPVQGGDELGV